MQRLKTSTLCLCGLLYFVLFASQYFTTVTVSVTQNASAATVPAATVPVTSSLLTEEEYVVQVSEASHQYRAFLREPRRVVYNFGTANEFLPLPPTRPLLKYSSSLSLHIQNSRRKKEKREDEKEEEGVNSMSLPISISFSSSSSSSSSLPSSSSSIPSSNHSFSSISSSVPLSSYSFSSVSPLSISTSPSSSSSILALVKELLELVEEVEISCVRFLKQGGRTCQRLPDGDKKVCSDPSVAPTWASCLVYSFGLGHDFSFDIAMAMLGCEVFVFDDDQYHDMYTNHPFTRIHFGHVRLGTKVLYQVVEDKVRNSTYAYMYRSLDNLMYLLGHTQASINLLKMDIEGDEWEVFKESIFKTNILERVGQLAVEIHMTDFLKPNITAEETVTALTKYIGFFKTLRSRGFRLAYHEPNYLSPTFTTVAGIAFSILAEQLWINTLFHPPPRSHHRHHHHHNTRAYKAIETVGEFM